jgi:hypothetical protein
MILKTINGLFLLLIFHLAEAQSLSPKSQPDCISQLLPGMNFIKNYKLDNSSDKRSKIEYSYVFTRGTTYNVHICHGGSKNVKTPELVIYDYNRHKVASNVSDGKTFNSTLYQCTSSGIFYLEYVLDQSFPYYGESILSFSANRKNEEKKIKTLP